MKWLLFAISLFALWVAFNALYMLPGPYTAFNFELAAAGIGVGTLTAWLSGKRFTHTERRKRRSSALMKAPPVVLLIFILVIFCAIGILRFLASR
jgi:membrane associated rhomboid family serine protease